MNALVLHGGGGPMTVAMISEHLARRMPVLAPTLPGWNGTPRPPWCTSVGDMAMMYLRLQAEEDRRDVAVIGSSLGGWIAAEMAVRDNEGRIKSLILIDAAGVLIEGQEIADYFALDPRGLAERSFHDPQRFFREPTPDEAAMRAANSATMKIIAGDPYMHNPNLLRQLAGVTVPATLIWGESDRIVTPAYGKAYAAAFPNGRFAVVANAGHLPQIEQPAATLALIDSALAA